MDKYELKVSIDEIDRLIGERSFAEAASVADMIDWSRWKGVQTLCKISDLYKINKRYADSRDLMELAYARNPGNRKIIYSLCELELKLNNYIHALQLYNAFINVAPRDPDRYLLQYKLYKKQDVNVHEQIAVLEEFLQRDFRERWAYELAALYHRAGDGQRCARQCDEIVAYFGDGRFVIRALELKKSFTMLTPQQEERLQALKAGRTVPPARDTASDGAGREAAQGQAAPGAAVGGEGTEAAQNQAGAGGGQGPEREGLKKENPGEEGPEKEGLKRENPGEEGPEREGLEKENPGEEGPKREGLEKEDPGEEGPEKEGPGKENPGEEASDDPFDAEAAGDESPEEFADVLLRGTDQQLSDENMRKTIARGMQEIAGEGEDGSLAEDRTGQLSMVMEEELEEEDAQSRIDLAQIMSGWEQIRRENERQRMAEARRRVLERSEAVKQELYGTGASFTASFPGEEGEGPAPEAGEEPANRQPTQSWKGVDVEAGLRNRR